MKRSCSYKGETRRERRVYRSWSLMQHIPGGTRSKAAFCPHSSKCASCQQCVYVFMCVNVLHLHVSLASCASVSSWKLSVACSWTNACPQTSAPSSITPVSIMGTSLSSTWTSRMVLSMWDRLTGSRLQGTQRWTTYTDTGREILERN